jgi:hypothetical protein
MPIHSTIFSASIPLVFLLATSGCSDETPASRGPAARAPSGSTTQAEPETLKQYAVSKSSDDQAFAECGGIRFAKPATWNWVRPTVQFRTLQYAVPGTDGVGDAELIFSFFRNQDGGPTDANLDRWAGQFRSVDGTPPREARSMREVNDTTVWFIELEGAYAGMGAAAPRSGTAQLGVIIEAPDRRVFVRLLGPAKTVLENKAVFESMINSLQAE